MENCVEINNKMNSKPEEYLSKRINELENKEKLLSDQNKKLYEEFTKKHKIIENCYKVLRNYKQMFRALQSICICNKTEINYEINNIEAINGRLLQQNWTHSEEMTENFNKFTQNIFRNFSKKYKICLDSENNEKKSIVKSDKIVFNKNNNEIKEKISVGTQVEDEDKDLIENSIDFMVSVKISVENQIKEEVMEVSDNTSLTNSNELNQQIVSHITVNENNNFSETVEDFEMSNSSEINDINGIFIYKYITEIPITEFMTTFPEFGKRIQSNTTEKQVIINDYLNKTKSEKNDIKRNILMNKSLFKRNEGHINYLSTVQKSIITGKKKYSQKSSEVFIGFECNYNGCDYRTISRIQVNNHIKECHLKTYPYVCETCKQVFTSIPKLNIHIKDEKHEREKYSIITESLKKVVTKDIGSGYQTVSDIKNNQKTYCRKKVEKPNNNEINAKPIDVNEIDLNENEDKDGNNEISITQDIKTSPEFGDRIVSKTNGKALIIKNYLKLTNKEKYRIRSSLLMNKNLMKKSEGKFNYLYVLQNTVVKAKNRFNLRSNEIRIGFECAYNGCDHRTTDRKSINKHTNAVHLKMNPFKCDICNIGFPSKSGLSTHINALHMADRLKCDFKLCKFVAKSQACLTFHLKSVHKYVRQHPCDWPGCERKFKRLYSLELHINTFHKRIKKYECHWPGCDSKFLTNDNLTVHNRVHTREKPFSCVWPDCGQRFSASTSLSIHQHMHEGLKPHPCPWNGCKVSFLRTGDLKRHVICHEKGGNLKCKCCVNRK